MQRAGRWLAAPCRRLYAADFQFEVLPPGELLFHLNGDGLHPVPVHQGILHDFHSFHLHGFPDGLCLLGMMQNPTEDGSLGFGVFVLQYRGGVEGGQLLNDDGEIKE